MPLAHRRSDRIGALGGIAFAALLFLSVFAAEPLRRVTDQQLLTGWAAGGLRRDLIASMVLMLLAGPCFLVFLAPLRDRLRAADPENPWLDLVHGAGLVFVATLTITACSRGLIAQAVRFGGEPLPGPDTLRYATQFSDAAFGLAAIPFAALLVAAASLLALRTGALARWVGWVGLGVAALSLVSVALLVGPLATPLIALWVLAVSAQLFRARETRAAHAETSPVLPQGQPQGALTPR